MQCSVPKYVVALNSAYHTAYRTLVGGHQSGVRIKQAIVPAYSFHTDKDVSIIGVIQDHVGTLM